MKELKSEKGKKKHNTKFTTDISILFITELFSADARLVWRNRWNLVSRSYVSILCLFPRICFRRLSLSASMYYEQRWVDDYDIALVAKL